MVARFQPLRLFFPEAIGLAAAIDAQAAAAAGELVDAAADFFAADRSFDELDAPRNPRQVGHIVGDMRAFGDPASSRPVKLTGLMTLLAPAWRASSSLSWARMTTLIGTCGDR